MTVSANEARKAYYREWRKKNPDKVRETNRRYWEKKAAQAAAAAALEEQPAPDQTEDGQAE